MKKPVQLVRYYSAADMGKMANNVNSLVGPGGEYVIKSIQEYSINGGGFIYVFEKYVAPAPKPQMGKKPFNNGNKGFEKKPYDKKPFDKGSAAPKFKF